MKQLKAEKHPITMYLRYEGRFTYLYIGNPAMKQKYIDALKSKGIEVIEGRKWLRYSLFSKGDLIKLGNVEIDINETPKETVMDVLCGFDQNTLEGQGFKCEVTNV